MGALQSWLLSVTAAAILCALADGLTPKGPVRGVERLTAGLVMAAVILSPLLKLEGGEGENWLENWQVEYEVQELERQRDEEMKAVIEEACGAYIVDKAAGMGAQCQVWVECREEGEGVFLPSRVTVRGALTSQQKQALTRQIQEDLGVPAQEQQYEAEEESS